VPTPVVALTVAGSDPSGGAGVQADLKAFSALGTYGAAVLTALTAQNTRGVTGVHPVPPEFVRAQLRAVLEDLDVAAVKVGMLGDRATIEALAEGLAGLDRPRVVDPVQVAKGGARLLREDAVGTLRERLLPLASLLTPNLPEAADLLGVPEPEVLGRPEEACRRLLELGPRAVLLKGGHAGGADSDDWLATAEGTVRLPAQRILTRNTHGTGCTLSAAITARLALGDELLDAVRAAKAYVHAAIAAAADWELGHGQGPVHAFHAWW
jgi:hydroxymethylpyrimidine/phosphomethylpyrimidine kinase